MVLEHLFCESLRESPFFLAASARALETGDMTTAAYWTTQSDGRVACGLCPQRCLLDEGATGKCGVRQVVAGSLAAVCYGMISAAHVDPIEKKPLYHFRPGSSIFSVGGWGCNLSCEFCQNWSISQESPASKTAHSPEAVVAQAVASGSGGIAYTYNEPLIAYEFVADCARVARASGLANVLVTNGYIESSPATELLPLIDALNIDVKSMDNEFYARYCGGGLAPVLAFAKQAVDAGCHVEITNLVIPGLNDGPDLFQALAEWMSAELGESTPLHLSAYRPEYRLRVPPTPGATLEQAYATCSELLAYVYLGNVSSPIGRDTRCPGCGEVLISREGYAASVCGLRDSRCANCGRAADLRL
jgi:pyruvate formate lyase activating enzyme